MNRQQVHFVVDDLAAGVRFYSSMFATEPSVLMSHYAKWMWDEPRVTFMIFVLGMTPDVTDVTALSLRRQAVDPQLTK